MQIEHYRAKERGRIILRGYRELLSELTRVLFYERRNQCIQQQNHPTDQISNIIQTQISSFQDLQLDYYLNQIFFNFSDASKKTMKTQDRD